MCFKKARYCYYLTKILKQISSRYSNINYLYSIRHFLPKFTSKEKYYLCHLFSSKEYRIINYFNLKKLEFLINLTFLYFKNVDLGRARNLISLSKIICLWILIDFIHLCILYCKILVKIISNYNSSHKYFLFTTINHLIQQISLNGISLLRLKNFFNYSYFFSLKNNLIFFSQIFFLIIIKLFFIFFFQFKKIINNSIFLK